MSRYPAMFAALKERGEGAFVPFVMVGDPDPATSEAVIEALIAGGADALELGPLRSPTILLTPRPGTAAGGFLPFCQTGGASHPAGVLCGEQAGGLPLGGTARCQL